MPPEKNASQEDYASGKRVMYDEANREQKARKLSAVLADYLGQIVPGASFLDIGCSTGLITASVGAPFSKVYGVDIDEKAVAFAKRQHPEKKYHFLLADGMETKLGSGSFDVVLCNHVYQHVPDDRVLAEKIHRLLKPDGICPSFPGSPNRWRISICD